MSKSIGNIVTINKLRKNVNGQVVRLALLSSHYKQPLDWNEKLIVESKNTLDRWYNQWEQIPPEEIEDDEVLKPLLDDLNTPEYITKLHSLYEKAKKENRISKVKFTTACNLIGLLESTPSAWKDFKKNQSAIDEKFINKKIEDRNIARKKGDFNKADVIRKELEENGVIIEDEQDKTVWKYK
jgi:cysteinyl-tRNA synthetase